MITIEILLVEDDSSFSKLFCEKLSRAMGEDFKYIKVSVIDSVNSDELCNPKFDIYFVDNRINGTSCAVDLLKKIDSCNKKRSKIFVMSKFGDFELVKTAWKSGADGFIDKDEINYKEIAGIIRAFYETKKMTAKLESKLRKKDASQ